jgi:hypothetical protein
MTRWQYRSPSSVALNGTVRDAATVERIQIHRRIGLGGVE